MADQLTLHEQTFINAMGYLCLVWGEPENVKMMLTVVRDTLPEVDEDHPRVGPLADAATAMMDAKLGKTLADRQRRYVQACTQGQHALAKIFIARAGAGWEALVGPKVVDLQERV